MVVVVVVVEVVEAVAVSVVVNGVVVVVGPVVVPVPVVNVDVVGTAGFPPRYRCLRRHVLSCVVRYSRGGTETRARSATAPRRMNRRPGSCRPSGGRRRKQQRSWRSRKRLLRGHRCRAATQRWEDGMGRSGLGRVGVGWTNPATTVFTCHPTFVPSNRCFTAQPRRRPLPPPPLSLPLSQSFLLCCGIRPVVHSKLRLSFRLSFRQFVCVFFPSIGPPFPPFVRSPVCSYARPSCSSVRSFDLPIHFSVRPSFRPSIHRPLVSIPCIPSNR